jgi:hypothetical protein
MIFHGISQNKVQYMDKRLENIDFSMDILSKSMEII